MTYFQKGIDQLLIQLSLTCFVLSRNGLGGCYKSSGTLTKLLQNGIPVEDDENDFEIQPREAGDTEYQFEKNNIEVDDNGKYFDSQPEIKDGKRMPTLYEVMQDEDFLAELRLGNELLNEL